MIKNVDGLSKSPLKDGSYIDTNAYEIIIDILNIIIVAGIKLIDNDFKQVFITYIQKDAHLLTPILLDRLNINTWEKVKHVIYDLQESGIFTLSEEDRNNLEQYFTDTKVIE